MDLVTLVTACSLTIDPKLMHALVWQQSRGEPWAASMQNGALPRVYASMPEAIREIRANAAASDTIRIGLAGVAVAPSTVTRAVFLPCRNVAMAATQLAKLSERCKAHPRLKSDPTSCAVAVYRGSWEKPDVDFAAAVEISFVRGNAPNFDISNGTEIELLDIASDMQALPADSISPESARALEEGKRGWSSALFPIRSQQSTAKLTDNATAMRLQSWCHQQRACPLIFRPATTPQVTSLCGGRPTEAGMIDTGFDRRISRDFASMTMGQGEPSLTNRRMAR